MAMSEFALDSGNTAWMLTAPGLAVFYGGMVRTKSVLNMMMMSFGALGLVGVIWILWGYSAAFGTQGNAFVGNPFQYFGLVGLTDQNSIMAASGVPALVGQTHQAEVLER